MNVLSIHNLEKQDKDILLFPKFNLEISRGDTVSIHSSLNIRESILKLFLGKSTINGEITVLEKKLSERNNLHELGIGISFLNQGLYQRLSVLDHLKLFKKLYDTDVSLEDVFTITQLSQVKHSAIRNLTFSEQRRVHLAILLVQNPELYIFEEPDWNVDMETRRVILNIVSYLKESGKAVLILTGNMENAITMADCVYRLNEDGIHKVDMQDTTVSPEMEVEEEPLEKEDVPITVNFNKIPTKVHDKIILFDPPEIDYIESNDGQSHVYIKGDSFPSVFTLNELEEKLKPFGFFRCHRSYIVNLQKVREVITWTRNSYSLVLDDKPKSTIPLSKTKMTQLKEMLGLK
ncbi:LytTR family transcriptional regulator DNA-binding domain-containing protein [Ornithinibacillus scapharcae]|uniref:LytTR family transcriptional regulator DNA-binding domain-containing protein n=1 Tax=Ornithinibacillus scapharcae TaxID=1147159 RepID=UPI000225C0DD|nr:LytTR family transcriptional regulator DNA-binding domain-containing protein [Ornithinibacillus scapharcae]